MPLSYKTLSTSATIRPLAPATCFFPQDTTKASALGDPWLESQITKGRINQLLLLGDSSALCPTTLRSSPPCILHLQAQQSFHFLLGQFPVASKENAVMRRLPRMRIFGPNDGEDRRSSSLRSQWIRMFTERLRGWRDSESQSRDLPAAVLPAHGTDTLAEQQSRTDSGDVVLALEERPSLYGVTLAPPTRLCPSWSQMSKDTLGVLDLVLCTPTQPSSRGVTTRMEKQVLTPRQGRCCNKTCRTAVK